MPNLILTARARRPTRFAGCVWARTTTSRSRSACSSFLARVERVAAHRAAGDGAGEPEEFGAVEVIPHPAPCCAAGRPVALTPKEFDLLLALLRRGGAVVSRMELLTEVWGYSAAVLSAPWTRTWPSCAQARGRSRGAAAYSHRPQGRLPTREIAVRSARVVLALLACVAGRSAGQASAGTTVTVHGFFERGDSGGWLLVLPDPVVVGGVPGQRAQGPRRRCPRGTGWNTVS